jgi:hypothetical protein
MLWFSQMSVQNELFVIIELPRHELLWNSTKCAGFSKIELCLVSNDSFGTVYSLT